MAQPKIAHGLNRATHPHEGTGLIAEKVIEDCSRAVLEHFHSPKEGARVEILIAHISEGGTVVGTPDLQRLARQHAAHEICRRVTVSVHHSGHRDIAITFNGLVDRTGWHRSSRSNIN
jgi:hypothetical protein